MKIESKPLIPGSGQIAKPVQDTKLVIPVSVSMTGDQLNVAENPTGVHSAMPAVSFVSDPPVPPVRSQISLELTDKNGFAEMSPDDLSAVIDGQITVRGDFLLQQLAKLPSNKDLRFDPPRFDSKRQQYVISGKALQVILGLITVGFEVRMGTDKGQLAFRVDNDIKRGIIYKQIAKQLDKLGLQTERRDHMLLVKPTYNKPISIPIDKTTGQTAEVTQIDSHAENVKFEIDAQGQLLIKLEKVNLALSSSTQSSEVEGHKQLKANPDQARIELDLGLDYDLKPTVQIKDGEVQTDSETLARVLPEKALTQVQEQFGTALSVRVSHIQGEVKLPAKAKSGSETAKVTPDIQLQAQLDVMSQDSPAYASAALSVALQAEQKHLSAQKLAIQTQSGQELTAAKISYKPGPEGTTIQAEAVNGQLSVAGLDAQVQDLTGTVKTTKGRIEADMTGKIRAQIDRPELSAKVATEGRHQISKDSQGIQATLEQAEVFATADLRNTEPKAKKAEDPAKTSQALDIKIQKLNGSAAVVTPANTANVILKDNQAHLKKNADGLHVQTQGDLNLSAEGDKVSGQSHLQGVELNQDAKGQLNVTLKDHQTQGRFANDKGLNVSGKLAGDATIERSADGKVTVKQHDGSFDASFAKGEKIKIAGQGKDLDFTIDAQENIELAVTDMDIKTDVNTGNVKVNARSKGQKASVRVQGDNIHVATQGARSEADLRVKTVVHTQGQVGDITLDIRQGSQGETIGIQVQDARLKTRVQNKNQNLQVNANTVGNAQVNVVGDDVTVKTRQSQNQVDLTLTSPDKKQTKVTTHAQGRDVTVKIQQDDVDIRLENATYSGKVTPNSRIAVDVKTTSAAPVIVQVKEGPQSSMIRVGSSAAVSGQVSINGKIESAFANPTGFDLQVKEDANSSLIEAKLAHLDLNGQVNTPGVGAKLTGSGDFALRIEEQNDQEQVKITYDGQLSGQAHAKQGHGDYQIQGQTQVRIQGQDVDIRTQGSMDLNANAPAQGVKGHVKLNGQQEGLQIQVRPAGVSVSVQEGGFVEIKDPQTLKLGNDPQLPQMLAHLHSKSVKVSYKDLMIKDNGAEVGLKVKSEGIQTHFGDVDLAMQIAKTGSDLQIEGGHLAFTPNRNFTEVIRDGLMKKYNIEIQGDPTFENGEIQIPGKITSKSGLVQLAKFTIKATVQDNKMVFDIEKANVLQVFGSNTVGKFLTRMLSKTDIDVFRNHNNSIEISLADIAKDLSLTQGVNFTDLKMVENRFEVGFYFNSEDQQIAKLAKSKDIKALTSYLQQTPVTALSEESLSTAFATLAKAKELDQAVSLMERVMRAYVESSAPAQRHQLERALVWMAKSQPTHKAKLEDDLAMALARRIQPTQAAGAALVNALPTDFVKEWANNLDLTISQGGAWAMISPAEREMANRLRTLKGLPANKRVI